MKKKFFAIRPLAAAAALATLAVLGACAAVQTTDSGTVGVERKQYMSSMVSEAALEQEAAQQYSSLIGQAKAQGALDTDAAQTARVKAISQKLIRQVGVFRPDAAKWNWQVHVLKYNDVTAWRSEERSVGKECVSQC